ncbi:hypothetical protein [Levilactobacillus acidifarinae]|uniref:hypothetical protein n=1 Tax=Levilactobacillus acidifarinae TaxID=267364 RepID=UPI00070D47D6|nr:hypothetical protein [Levilactobacillus acidifarinae]GEO69699.1 hypothetical protein LAC03_16090 [Levilactobacillus acidifarinae]
MTKKAGDKMQETKRSVATAASSMDKRTKIEIIGLMLVLVSPLLIALGTFHWTTLPLVELLIIGIMVIAITIGITKIAKQLVLAIKEGADTDYRER